MKEWIDGKRRENISFLKRRQWYELLSLEGGKISVRKDNFFFVRTNTIMEIFDNGWSCLYTWVCSESYALQNQLLRNFLLLIAALLKVERERMRAWKAWKRDWNERGAWEFWQETRSYKQVWRTIFFSLHHGNRFEVLGESNVVFKLIFAITMHCFKFFLLPQTLIKMLLLPEVLG